MFVAECLNQTESSKHDNRKPSGAVAWAFGSPSIERTWKQKEPRQCPCFGSTPTRVRLQVVTGREGDQEGHEESDVPSAAELFSGMTFVESVTAPLSLVVSHSQEEAKGKRTQAK